MHKAESNLPFPYRYRLSQKFRSKSFSMHRFNLCKRSVMLFEKPFQKCRQSLCLYIVVAGRPDKLCQLRLFDRIKFIKTHQGRLFQIQDGFFNVLPVCVLGQDCARDNLVLRFARPPVLRTKPLEKQLKYLLYLLSCYIHSCIIQYLFICVNRICFAFLASSG